MEDCACADVAQASPPGPGLYTYMAVPLQLLRRTAAKGTEADIFRGQQNYGGREGVDGQPEEGARQTLKQA